MYPFYEVYTIARRVHDWYRNVAESFEWVYTRYTIYVVINHVYTTYTSNIYQMYDISECHISGICHSLIYEKYHILCTHGAFLHVICQVYTIHIGIIYMH